MCLKLRIESIPNDVGLNGQSIVTKKSDGTVVVGPDVCKTPSPGGPVPIPYPNFSFSGDLANGSKNVKVNGVPACMKGSNFSKSTGDEAGSLGGLLSNKTASKAEPVTYSFDVKIEGKNVVRNFDMFQSNGKNTLPGLIMQTPILLSLFGDANEKLHACLWQHCDKNTPRKLNTRTKAVSRAATNTLEIGQNRGKTAQAQHQAKF